MKVSRFIVVDDDFASNTVCRIIIKRAAAGSDIQTFEYPEQGFEYISKEYLHNTVFTVLFLDINMPVWSGWDFLDNFEKLDEKIKKQFKIYMLSSSIDPNDKKRAMDNKNVIDYIEKPISIEIISRIKREAEL